MSHIASGSSLVLHSSVLLLVTTTLVRITLSLRLFIRVLAVPIVTFASVLGGVIVAWLPAVVIVLVVVTITSHRPILINLAHFVTHFVSDLATLLSSTKLSLRFKTIVPINTNHATINHYFVQEFHCNSGILPPRILHEAKAAILVCFFI